MMIFSVGNHQKNEDLPLQTSNYKHQYSHFSTRIKLQYPKGWCL